MASNEWKNDGMRNAGVCTSQRRKNMLKVNFNLNENKICYLRDNIDVKCYRKPYWQLIALDRCRFKRRIEIMSDILNPILNVDHRMYIYNKYFK